MELRTDRRRVGLLLILGRGQECVGRRDARLHTHQLDLELGERALQVAVSVEHLVVPRDEVVVGGGHATQRALDAATLFADLLELSTAAAHVALFPGDELTTHTRGAVAERGGRLGLLPQVGEHADSVGRADGCVEADDEIVGLADELA